MLRSLPHETALRAPARMTVPAVLVFLTLSVVLILSAGGCATTAKYEAMLHTWVGQPEKALVSSWGTPHRVYESGGTKWLTFVNTETVNVSGSAPTYKKNREGEYVPYGGSSPSSYTTTCETTFEIEGGVVRRWRHKGDGCEME